MTDHDPSLPQEDAEETPTLGVKELQELSESLQEYKEKYLRLLAESENARKRMQKEREDLTKYAIENVIIEFLHPLDHFEKALSLAEDASSEVRNWAVGFEMILGQFRDVLASNGVKAYETVDTMFDPHLHEAVEMVETEESAPGRIVEECVKGYKMGDKAIRVARVKVAKEPSAETNSQEKENNQGEKNDRE